MKKLAILILILLVVTACIQTEDIGEISEDHELRMEVDTLFHQFKYKDARELLESRLKDGLTDVEVLQQYSFLEYKLYQDYSKAEELLDRAVLLDPDNFKIHFTRAELLLDKGDYGSAAEAAALAIELFGNPGKDWSFELSHLHHLVGLAQIGLEDSQAAIGSFELSLQYNPYKANSSRLLHHLYVQVGDYIKALETWQLENMAADKVQLLRIQEHNEFYYGAVVGELGHSKLAEVYRDLGLLDEYRLELERALAQSNDTELGKELERISTFLSFRDELLLFFDDYYRKRSLNGLSAENAIYSRLEEVYNIVAPLYNDVSRPSAQQWIESINTNIQQEFGVRIEFLKSEGVYFGLHFG